MKLDTIMSIKASYVVYPIVLVVIISVFAFEYATSDLTQEILGYDGASSTDQTVLALKEGSLPAITGYLDESSEKAYALEQGNVTEVSAVLTWSDEPDQNLMVNEPDYFGLTLISPTGDSRSSGAVPNPPGGQGLVELRLSIPQDNASADRWTVLVQAGECGDHQGFVRTEDDPGNQYTLQVSYSYMGVA